MGMFKEQLNDKQLRIVQIIAGILCAAALSFSIFITSLIKTEENSVLNYLFVAVFFVIMIGRRRIEAKYRIRLSLFSLTLINGLVGGIILFFVINYNIMPLDNNIKLLILNGITVLTLILGIILPLTRYMKRKENGTTIPIRLPEQPEEPEADNTEDDDDDDGPLTVEQKIAQMTKELDGEDDGK